MESTVPRLRPRFTLRTLLIVVALCALAPAAYVYRPGQMDPELIQVGMSIWYVRWYCGASLPTTDAGNVPEVWVYTAPQRTQPAHVWIEFDEAGRVSKKVLITERGSV